MKRSLAIAASLSLAIIAFAAYDGMLLTRVAKPGDLAKYKLTAELEYMGSPVTVTALMTEKVSQVATNGNITIEQATTNVSIDFDGTPIKIPDNPSAVISITSTPLGTIVGTKADFATDSLMRLWVLQALTTAGKPVQMGELWAFTLPKTANTAEIKGSYTVEAAEKIGEYDTYRIKGSTKESDGANPASVQATYWINVKDGSVVKVVGNWTNAPIPQVGPSKAKLTVSRQN